MDIACEGNLAMGAIVGLEVFCCFEESDDGLGSEEMDGSIVPTDGVVAIVGSAVGVVVGSLVGRNVVGLFVGSFVVGLFVGSFGQ